MSLFDDAFDALLKHEGGYVNDPRDPGGETKFGITKRQYPDLDIAALTEADAREIYRRDWWVRYGYDRIAPHTIAIKMLGLAVNMGPDDAGRCLQRALRACGFEVVEDGIVGSRTRDLAARAQAWALIAALRSEAACHYRLEAARGDNPIAGAALAGWLERAYA